MKKVVIRFLILGLIFIVQCYSVFACMCGRSSISDMYKESDIVVIAKIISFKSAEVSQDIIYEDGRRKKQVTDGQEVKLKIEKWFKGNKKEKIITLSQPNSTCDWRFENKDLNKTFLFYLSHNKNHQTFTVVTCGRSSIIKNANDDLSWLNGLPKSLARTRISGVVKLNNEDNLFPEVSKIKIKIVFGIKEYNLVTDKNGLYEIWDLPVGNYKITAEIPNDKILGWTTSVPNNWTYFWSIQEPNYDALKVTLEPNSCGGVDFTLKNK